MFSLRLSSGNPQSSDVSCSVIFNLQVCPGQVIFNLWLCRVVVCITSAVSGVIFVSDNLRSSGISCGF